MSLFFLDTGNYDTPLASALWAIAPTLALFISIPASLFITLLFDVTVLNNRILSKNYAVC